MEAIAAGVCAALRPDDLITSTHRGHGHCVAKGLSLERMMAEIIGRADGYCGGKGSSMHITALEKGMLGADAIVAGSSAIAVERPTACGSGGETPSSSASSGTGRQQGHPPRGVQLRGRPAGSRRLRLREQRVGDLDGRSCVSAIREMTDARLLVIDPR